MPTTVEVSPDLVTVEVSPSPPITVEIGTFSMMASGTGWPFDVYSSELESVVASSGSALTTLVITSPQALGASLAIPANVSIEIKQGGVITVPTGETLTIAGSFDAGQYRCFDGDGPVVLSGCDNVQTVWLTAGNGTDNDTNGLQSAFSSGPPVFVNKPSTFYKTTATLTSGSQANIRFESEDTVIRMVSGAGYVFEIDGGEAQVPSVKHVHLEGGTFSGYDTLASAYNPDCLGGIKIKGAYVVTLDRMHCSQFSHVDGIALLLENVFNAEISNSRFNCGTAKEDQQGDIGCKITISDGSPFNITQVVLTNNLFQFNTRYGIAITREGSTGSIDGITIDNNGIGHNGTAGIALVTQELRAVTVNNNHIEGAGTYGVYVPFSGTNATILSNQIQDAVTAIYHNGKGEVANNVVLGSAVPVGTKYGIILGAAALVKVGVNNIYGTWVTTAANWYINRTAGITESQPTIVIGVTNGGSGYTNGDLLTITTGGVGGTVYAEVTAGVVTAVYLNTEGYGYSVGAGKATSGGAGTGCTLQINLLTSARPDYGLILCTQTLFTNYYSANAASYRGAMLNITDASLETDRFFISHSGGWKRFVIADAIQTLTNKTLTAPIVDTIQTFADNTAAAALATGTVYRTATGVLMVKY